MAVKPTQKLINKVFRDVETREDVDSAMDRLNELLGGYGVEAITDENAWIGHYYMNIIGLYVNMGDTYDTTVVYDTDTEEAHVGSWGNFYEAWLAENVSEEELEGLGTGGLGEIYFTTGRRGWEGATQPFIRLSTETTGKKGALYDIELWMGGTIKYVNRVRVNNFKTSQRKAIQMEAVYDEMLPALLHLLTLPGDSKEYRDLWWEIKQAIRKVE